MVAKCNFLSVVSLLPRRVSDNRPIFRAIALMRRCSTSRIWLLPNNVLEIHRPGVFGFRACPLVQEKVLWAHLSSFPSCVQLLP